MALIRGPKVYTDFETRAGVVLRANLDDAVRLGRRFTFGFAQLCFVLRVGVWGWSYICL